MQINGSHLWMYCIHWVCHSVFDYTYLVHLKLCTFKCILFFFHIERQIKKKHYFFEINLGDAEQMRLSFICNIVRQICVENDYSQWHCWFLGLKDCFSFSSNHCGKKTFLVWNSSNICLKMEFSRLMNGWLCLWLLPFTLGPYFTLVCLFGGTE